MQQPDMRICPVHHFAIHLQNQTQDAVSGWMLRPEVKCQRRLRLLPSASPSFTFASPGSNEVAPSQGDK